MNPDDKKVIEALKKSAEDVEVPSSLEPSAILLRLEEAESVNAESQETATSNKSKSSSRFKIHRGRRMQVAMAACLAILCGVGLLAAGVVSGRSQIEGQIANENLDTTPQTIGEVSPIPVASSYQQLYDLLGASKNASVSPYGYGDEITGRNDALLESSEGISDIPDIPISGLTDTTEKNSALSKASGDYSQTNVRTEGIEEADIVKTDGKVIYSLQNYGSRLSMVMANAGKMEKAATIKARNAAKGTSDFIEFFVADNRLYLISNVYEDDSNGCTKTIVSTFDVSDPRKPRKIATVEQAGYYYSSRMVDGYLYLFTNFYPYVNGDQKNISRYVPTAGAESLACTDVYVPSFGGASEYLVAGSIKAGDPTKLVQTKAVLSGTGGIYVSNDSIYVYSPKKTAVGAKDIALAKEETVDSSSSTEEAEGEKKLVEVDGEIWVDDGFSTGPLLNDETEICKLSYKDGVFEPVGETSIRGSLDDSFSIDEYKGNTRIFATVFDEDGIAADGEAGVTFNNVYVLNERLEQIGSVENLAPGEVIYSARFMGDIGYFVTYKQVDPLFSVDFSDPAHPKIIGELKIPGFSEYLHPWGEGRMLGIGQATSKNGAVTDGLKLTMFDTSDPSNVRELDTFVLKGMYYSDALYDYRAVYADVDRGLIGFFAEDSRAYYYLFSYNEQDGFSVRIRDQVSQAYGYGARGVSISDTFYVAAQGLMDSYNMGDFEKISQIKL